MVAQSGRFRPSFNAGEWGPAFDSRVDLNEFYSAARRMLNVEPLPASGFRLMAGSVDKGRVRRQLQLLNGSRTVTPGPFVAAGQVEIVSFSEQEICAVSLQGYHVLENVSATVEVEWKNGAGVWQQLGAAITVDNIVRNRVVALPPGQFVLATDIRLMIYPTASVTWSNTDTVMYLELPDLAAAVRCYDYSISKESSFIIVVTEGWCDVWKGGVYTASFVTEITAGMIPVLNIIEEANTIGFFHNDLKSLRAFREFNQDHQWGVDDWPYKEIGTVDYGGTYPTTDDEWQIYMRYASTGLSKIVMVLNVGGEETSSVLLNVDPAAATNAQWVVFAAALQSALESLPSFGVGVTVIPAVGANPEYMEFIVNFGGAYSGVSYGFSAQITNTSDASALVSHTKIGKTDGEPIISTARGWPGHAALVQDRYAYSNLKAKPSGGVMSENAEYFNLNIDRTPDDSAFVFAYRNDRNETINHLIWSKYLLVLSSDAEYFVNNRKISRNEPLNFIKASSYGSSASVVPRDAEGLLYFVDPTGNVLYRASYDDVQTSYVSHAQSIFSDHLFVGVVESALRKPDTESSSHRILYRRNDGRLIQVMVINNQNLSAFSEWGTDGEILSVAVDRQDRVFLAVKRTFAGGDEICFEMWDDNQWLHGAKNFGATDVDGLLTGLSEYEGLNIWVVADGYSLGKYMVAGGQIKLPVFYSSVTLGWWTAPIAEPMPFLLVRGDNEIVRRPGRIHTFRGAVVKTTSIAIGANGEAPIDQPLYRAGQAVDQPQEPYTGELHVSGISGFGEPASVVITQTKPGALQLRDVLVEARL